MSIPPERSPADLALNRVRHIFSPRRQRHVAIAVAGLVLLIWASWWLTHKHIAASLNYGLFDGRTHWLIDHTNWASGGTTEVNLGGHFNDYWSLHGVESRNRLAPLLDLHHVVALDLRDNPSLRNDEFGPLARLNHLKQLSIARSPGATIGVDQYRHALDEVAPALSGLITLEELDLSGTDLTDAGLAKLSRLTNLKRLDLSGTRITDQGLQSLQAMSALEELSIENTAVTRSAIEAFVKERPGLYVLSLVANPTAP